MLDKERNKYKDALGGMRAFLENRGAGGLPVSRVAADLILALLAPVLATPNSFHARTLARHRVSITTAALQGYRVEHGKFPQALEDLIPALLPDIPNDPFTGAPLQYRRPPEGNVLIYSVGENQKDDHGKGKDSGGDDIALSLQ